MSTAPKNRKTSAAAPSAAQPRTYTDTLERMFKRYPPEQFTLETQLTGWLSLCPARLQLQKALIENGKLTDLALQALLEESKLTVCSVKLSALGAASPTLTIHALRKVETNDDLRELQLTAFQQLLSMDSPNDTSTSAGPVSNASSPAHDEVPPQAQARRSISIVPVFPEQPSSSSPALAAPPAEPTPPAADATPASVPQTDADADPPAAPADSAAGATPDPDQQFSADIGHAVRRRLIWNATTLGETLPRVSSTAEANRLLTDQALKLKARST